MSTHSPFVALACAAAFLSCGGTPPPARPAGSAKPPAPSIPARIDGEFAVAQVARDAWVITHEPFHASNVLVVRMADGTLVICSSPFETEGTRAMLKWLRATFQPRRIIAINTHFHLDGTAGNQAYVEDGVETYASKSTQELLATRGAAMREEAAAAFSDPALRDRVTRTNIVAAAHTFPAGEGLSFVIAGEPVRVLHPGPAHSPDNVVVHFPGRDLLFGGCMIKAGPSIGFIGHAVLDRWEASVRALQALAPRVVVPGHGGTGGPELFDNTIALVRAAIAAR